MGRGGEPPASAIPAGTALAGAIERGEWVQPPAVCWAGVTRVLKPHSPIAPGGALAPPGRVPEPPATIRVRTPRSSAAIWQPEHGAGNSRPLPNLTLADRRPVLTLPIEPGPYGEASLDAHREALADLVQHRFVPEVAAGQQQQSSSAACGRAAAEQQRFHALHTRRCMFAKAEGIDPQTRWLIMAILPKAAQPVEINVRAGETCEAIMQRLLQLVVALPRYHPAAVSDKAKAALTAQAQDGRIVLHHQGEALNPRYSLAQCGLFDGALCELSVVGAAAGKGGSSSRIFTQQQQQQAQQPPATSAAMGIASPRGKRQALRPITPSLAETTTGAGHFETAAAAASAKAVANEGVLNRQRARYGAPLVQQWEDAVAPTTPSLSGSGMARRTPSRRRGNHHAAAEWRGHRGGGAAAAAPSVTYSMDTR